MLRYIKSISHIGVRTGPCNFYSTGLREEKIKIGKYNINYLKVGHGDHNLILTPGGLGTIWTDFKNQIEQFDKSKFTMVIWDPPGYGKSYPPERDFTRNSFENDANVAYDLMKKLEINDYSALGWSSGGTSSLILAAKHPEVIRKVVVWNALSFILPHEIAAFRSIKDISKWSPVLREAMLKVYDKENLQKYWIKWIDGMGKSLEENMDICTDKLQYITCPTMALHGAKDPLIDKNHSIYLNKNITNCALYLYPDGKHDIHKQFSEDFNRRVQDFLLSSS